MLDFKIVIKNSKISKYFYGNLLNICLQRIEPATIVY